VRGRPQITVSSLSTAAVSRRVDLVLVATTGGGNKTVSGTYNIAFYSYSPSAVHRAP